jgi:hypothetical protein
MFLGKIATPVGTSTRSTLEWTPGAWASKALSRMGS